MAKCTHQRKKSFLTVFAISLKKTDRRSINNAIFIGQYSKALPKLYDDFKGFGKMGVSSFRLNWDYSFAQRNNGDHFGKGKQVQSFEKTGEYLSKFSSEDLRLASCVLLNHGLMLTEEEKSVGTRIKTRITEELPLL